MKTRTELSKDDWDLIQATKDTADRLYKNDKHEVATICSAASHGCHNFEVIVAIWWNPMRVHFLLSPCGRCREVISDFNAETRVIVGSLDNPYRVRVSKLLPMKND